MVKKEDKFGQELNIGDEVVYTYCQALRKGKIVRFTRIGFPIIDSWPTTRHNLVTGFYERCEREASLGRWKDCVKLNPTYIRSPEKIDLILKDR
jgi:hypothetical protein